MLVKEIEKKRLQLVDIAKTYGLASIQTLRCSQELDQLIKAYQQERFEQNKKSSWIDLEMK